MHACIIIGLTYLPLFASSPVLSIPSMPCPYVESSVPHRPHSYLMKYNIIYPNKYRLRELWESKFVNLSRLCCSTVAENRLMPFRFRCRSSSACEFSALEGKDLELHHQVRPNFPLP